MIHTKEYMKLELNLWFNKNHTINGHLNINAGENKFKFSNIEDIDTFVRRGVAAGIASQEEFIELCTTLNLDPDARYAWIGTDFIYWNNTKKVAYAFYDSKMHTLLLNTRYSKKYTSQPDTCFEITLKD